MRRRSVSLLLVVMMLGLLGTGLAAAALDRADRNGNSRALTEQTHSVAQTVAAEIHRYGDALGDIAAAIGAQADLSAPEFMAITAPIDRGRLPGATGISFLIPASTEEIPALQAYWRARGATGLVLAPAPRSGGKHLFVVLIRTVDGTTPVIGRDLTPASSAVEAVDLSRRTGRTAASRPYRFLRDAGLPPAQQQLSVILTAPVYATSPAATDRGEFRGWMVLGVRGTDFLRQAIGVVARDTVEVTLSDTAHDGERTVLASWKPTAATTDDTVARTVEVAAPQRTWQLQVAPTNRLVPGAGPRPAAAAWAVGTIITLLLAALTATVTTSRDRALRRVAEATAALRNDITRREQVEVQLRQREAELVGFAGVVAHDLRGPLAGIIGYSDFLREDAAPHLNAEHREMLERLRGGAARMRALLDDLLEYATADNRELKVTRVDLDEVVADIVTERTRPIRPAATVAVGHLPTVDGDPVLLRQALDNLIGNALKYTRYGHPPYVEISATPDDRWWRIEISDRGIGIPADQRDGVFTAFHRAAGSERYPGTGLGLAIVHRVVERHRGRIGVNDNEHGGSVFWIDLPVPPG